MTPSAAAAVRTHLACLVRAWLGVPAGKDVPDLPADLARRVLRLEEYEQAHRDQWGNWEFAFCESFRDGRLLEADVDAWLSERRRELGASAAPGFWPGGRPFGVCLTHDVDLMSEKLTPRQAARSMRTSLLGPTGSRRESVLRLARPGVRAARALYHGISTAPAADMVELCVDLEREWGVGASYFFTVHVGTDGHRYDCVYDFGDACRFRGERVLVADVMRTLRNEGFDVGLHGSYHSATRPDLLAREKAALEHALGGPVTTTRQHFVHWHIGTTPCAQADAGLRADSSLGFNRGIGVRAGTSLPFRWFDATRGRALDLVQVPFLAQDGALFRADALELDLAQAKAVLRRAIGRAESVGGLVTLVFHPNNLADGRCLALLRSVVEDALARGAWFGSVSDVDALWRARESAARA